MKMLVVGAGVIGTVYGAHIAAAGSKVSVLSHGPRTSEVAAAGLSARDVLSGGRVDTEADVVPDASGDYDLVLVAVPAWSALLSMRRTRGPGREAGRSLLRQ
jgi:2-dehydropantoate 2-reductase